MSLPPVTSTGTQKAQQTSEAGQSTSTQKTETSKEVQQSSSTDSLSDTAKAKRLQESNIPGQTMRSQLDSALEKGKDDSTGSSKALGGPDTKNALGGPDTKTSANEMPKDAAQLAQKSNAELLDLAKTSEGEQKLKQLAQDSKKDGLTPEELKQMERIDAATFRPGAGLMLHGKPEDKEKFIQMTRQTMLESPSFHQRMKTINHDPLHLTQIEVFRGEGGEKDGTRVGSFSKFHNDGRQKIDLNDLEKFPDTPFPNSESITRGEILVHEYTEANQGAQNFLDPKNRVEQEKMFKPAHAEAIQAENEYRKDIGQKSQRKIPPEKEPLRFENPVTVEFDDGHSEKLVYERDYKLKTVTFVPANAPKTR